MKKKPKKQKKVTKAILKKREKRKIKREFKKDLGLWKEGIIFRDNNKCQKCGKDLKEQQKHCHHLVSLQNVKRKYPFLLEDIDNGILLCSVCHKFAPDSAHQGSLEFSVWFFENKPLQAERLLSKIQEKTNDNLS